MKRKKIILCILFLLLVLPFTVKSQQVESIKDYLSPAVKNGGFSMDDYILWCPTVIKVDGTYHMFASRWPVKYGLGGWTKYSECVRATSKNLYGPYEFQEVVLQKRPDAWDNSRVHNVKIVKTKDKFVLYYINSANQTGYAEADKITGPWTRVDEPVLRFSNPAPLLREDGSVYVFGRLRDADDKNRGLAAVAPSYKGPYSLVEEGKNLLPNDFELEDPTIWWANNQYNIICNDWKAKATGVTKGGAQYYSKDGVTYHLVSQKPIFNRNEPVVYDDGSTEKFARIERPFVFTNEKNEVIALFTANLYSDSLGGRAKIVVHPVKNYYPKEVAAKARRGTSQGLPDARLPYTPGKPVKYWSLATAASIMARYPDYREAYWKPWSYVQGYIFYGFEMLYRYTGDARYMDFIKKYVDHFVDEQGNFHGDKLTNLDNIMTGNSIVGLYEYTKEIRYKTAADQFRKAFDTYPRSYDGQFWHGDKSPNMWIDGVFMGQMFLIRYGKSIGDTGYCFDEAARQVLVCAKHLRKENSGLYLHAWTEKPESVKWADPKTGLSPEVWSEGMGWFALVVAELLAEMPQTHPKYNEIKNIYLEMAADLKKQQDKKTGGWYMIVDKGNHPDNWIDPSGTGMFLYALQKGIELNLISHREYNPVVKKAYKCLISFAKINERGLVDIEGGGDGISVKPDYETYVNYNRMTNAKETVGAFLWGTTIMEKPKKEPGNKI